MDDYFPCQSIRVTMQAQNGSDAGDCISAEESLCLELMNQPRNEKSYMVDWLKVQPSDRVIWSVVSGGCSDLVALVAGNMGEE